MQSNLFGGGIDVASHTMSDGTKLTDDVLSALKQAGINRAPEDLIGRKFDFSAIFGPRFYICGTITGLACTEEFLRLFVSVPQALWPVAYLEFTRPMEYTSREGWLVATRSMRLGSMWEGRDWVLEDVRVGGSLYIENERVTPIRCKT